MAQEEHSTTPGYPTPFCHSASTGFHWMMFWPWHMVKIPIDKWPRNPDILIVTYNHHCWYICIYIYNQEGFIIIDYSSSLVNDPYQTSLPDFLSHLPSSDRTKRGRCQTGAWRRTSNLFSAVWGISCLHRCAKLGPPKRTPKFGKFWNHFGE